MLAKHDEINVSVSTSGLCNTAKKDIGCAFIDTVEVLKSSTYLIICDVTPVAVEVSVVAEGVEAWHQI